MRPTARAAILFFFAIIFSGAGFAQDIKLHFATGTDFSRFKTYMWQRAKNANYQDAVVDRIIKKTIAEQLAAKGLTESTGDTSDIYIVYQMAVGQDVEWSSFTTDATYTIGAYDMVGYGGATTNSAEMIRRGWLMIDIYDNADKKLVWQTNAVKTLGKGNDPAKMEKNARKAMVKIFKNYPPPPK
jgi:hypothetical protein